MHVELLMLVLVLENAPDGGPVRLGPDVLASRLLSLSDADREAAVRALSRQELAEVYRRTTQETYLSLGRKALAGFGVYGARLTKQERIDGRLQPPQVVEMIFRERPRAVRLEFVDGPRKGRKVLYNEQIRPREMLARESGVLGFSTFWVDIHGPLAKRDTNHPITDLGFSSLIALMESDLKAARSSGGHKRTDEGFDAAGRWCLAFTAPPRARGLYAHRTRFCVDLAIGVPLLIEVYDSKGLLERYEYNALRPRQAVSPEIFTPRGAGL